MTTPKHEPIKELRYKLVIDMSMAYEDADNPDLMTASEVRDEAQSWLEDLGFKVDITVFNMGV